MIKATDRKLVVGLEIGTAKVAALVGEVLPDGMVNIIGVGSCPSRGMDKGGVNDSNPWSSAYNAPLTRQN